MRGLLHTAGERVELTCAVPWIADILTEGAGRAAHGRRRHHAGCQGDGRALPAAFDVTGWRVLTRDTWCRQGQVIIRDACSSGLDLQVGGRARLRGGPLAAVWPGTSRGGRLRARARLLLRAVLLQYPALWRSQQRGRAPLHASVCSRRRRGQTVMLAGPGGIGKSTLVYGELLSAAACTCDNLCVSDGSTRGAWSNHCGCPPRDGGRAADAVRPPEAARPRRTDREPDRLVVLARGQARAHQSTPVAAAARPRRRHFMAGELRRYWAFAATLALGTGLGGSHPPVQAIADTLSSRLPCLRVTLGDHPSGLRCCASCSGSRRRRRPRGYQHDRQRHDRQQASGGTGHHAV